MIQTSPNGIRSFLIWVWGGVLILGALLYLAISTGVLAPTGSMLPVIAAACALIGMPFLGRYMAKREQWALLTAWVFVALGGIIATLFFFPNNPQLILTSALIAVAIPLGVAYFTDRTRWWLALIAYIALTAAALVILTAFSAPLEAMGGVVGMAVALAFWGIAALYPQARWAVIPAVALTVGALIVLVFFVILEPGTSAYFIVLNGTLAALMFAIWHAIRPLDWAAWIGAGFTGAAILSYWYPSPANWALIALALGGYLVYRQVRATAVIAKSTPAPQAATPATRPPAPSTTPAAAPSTPAQSVSLPQSAPSVQAAPSSQPVPAPTPEPPPPAVKGPPPGVEFIPLDPFKTRKKDED